VGGSFSEELGYPSGYELLGRQRRFQETSLESLLACRLGKRSLPSSVGIAQDERPDAIWVEAIELLGENPAPRQPEDLCTFGADDV
jgi:hypothetical protein